MTSDDPERAPDSKETLYQAALSAIEDRSAKDAAARMAPRATRSNPIRLLVLAAVAVAAVVILSLRPVWLVGPAAPPPEPAAIAAASLRLTLLRERQRVLDFERVHGRLPATLAEAGSQLAGIDYTPGTDARFTLRALAGDSLIVLQSGDGTGAFLGGSIRALMKRGGR